MTWSLAKDISEHHAAANQSDLEALRALQAVLPPILRCEGSRVKVVAGMIGHEISWEAEVVRRKYLRL